MIVRTMMEINLGDGRKEYVDSKVYNIIRHEGYMQGRANAIDEFAEAIRKYIGNNGVIPINIIAEQLKEKKNV